MQILGEAFLVLRIIVSDIIKNLRTVWWKVPVIIVRFYWKWIFSTDF